MLDLVKSKGLPTPRDGGSARIRREQFRPVLPVHRRSCASLRPRHTTPRDGGSVRPCQEQRHTAPQGMGEVLGLVRNKGIPPPKGRGKCRNPPGADSGPYFLYIAAPAHPCARGIPYFLYIAAPAHPCARGIPYFLYIKKGSTRLPKSSAD